MMKYNKIHILFILTTTIFFSSCEDLLKEDMYSELGVDNVFNNEAGAKAVLYSGYSEAKFSGWNGKGMTNLEEWCTDIEWETAGGENKTAVLMINFTWDASTGWIESLLWNQPYRGIRDANVILDNIEGTSLDEDIKVLYKAEARFIRAMLYYHLYTWFGPVPLRTSEMQELEQAKATETEILNFIETEFTEIIDDLPAPGEEEAYGRAHKGAAWAFLCKFYLNTKQWQKCSDAADKVIAMNYYELYPDYVELFNVDNEINKEFIWVHEGISDGIGCEYINGAFPPSFKKDPITGFEWTSNMANWAAQYRLYDSFYNSFEDGDERKDLILAKYINTNGDTISLLNDNNTRSFKYWPDPNAQANEHGNDIPEIRYSDILLSKAEALNELNGPTQEALDLIDQVRNRAGLEDLQLSDYDAKDKLRDHILDERGWEFYSERKRRQDLIRHGKFVESAISRGVNADDYRVKFPIPQSEIDANPNLIQNDGY